MIRSVRDLNVSQRGMAFARRMCEMAAPLPTNERFGSVTQLRRAAVSVPANIAEGHGRDSTRECLRFALGSTAELATWVDPTIDVRAVDVETRSALPNEIEQLPRMLRSLQASLKAKLPASCPPLPAP